MDPVKLRAFRVYLDNGKGQGSWGDGCTPSAALTAARSHWRLGFGSGRPERARLVFLDTDWAPLDWKVRTWKALTAAVAAVARTRPALAAAVSEG